MVPEAPWGCYCPQVSPGDKASFGPCRGDQGWQGGAELTLVPCPLSMRLPASRPHTSLSEAAWCSP